MKFVILEEECFRSFLDQHPLKTFLQTPEIAKVRKKAGWKVHYVGVEEEGVLIAATMMISKERKLGRLEFYAPRGLLVDYENERQLRFFTESLKRYIKEHKGYVLRIDPYYIRRQRDMNGDIVEGGVDHQNVVSTLLALGYRKVMPLEQVGFTFVLDLDCSKEELLKRMRSFTRRNLNKGLKNHIVIRRVSYEELGLVKDLLDATCERKQFANRSLDYFQNMYEAFQPKEQIQFVVADIHLKALADDLKAQVETMKKHLSALQAQNGKQTKIDMQSEQIERLEQEIKRVDADISIYGEKVAASSGVFLTYGEEVLYLFGGNKKELMHYCSPYVVQWEMICYGIEHHFKRYNFYGISGNFDKNDKDYGIYDFKKGFTGYVEELIGEYALPIDHYYFLFDLIHKIKR